MLSRALAVGVALSGVAALAGTPWEHPPHPLWVDPNTVDVQPCSMTRAQSERSVWAANIWPGGVVPYVVDGGVTQQNRDRLRIAMNELETVCNVQFVERTSQSDYIYVQNGGGNNSFVGRVGGAQVVNLVNWEVRYIVIHELMHALGMWHEQQRSDRADYIGINFANIQPGYEGNFGVAGSAVFGDYNFESIMHYGACDLSTCCPSGSTCGCSVACRTIQPQQQYEHLVGVMGNRSYMSEGDKLGLAALYGEPIDDFMEPNDSPATAYLMQPGQHTDRRLTDTDDYFAVPPGSVSGLGVRLRAGQWCASNVTMALLTPGGTVLASGVPQDADADGVYEVTLQTGAATDTTLIRVRRVQPWGGSYTLVVTRGCDATPWERVNPPTGPSPRTEHAMSYDLLRGRTVVYGGLNDDMEGQLGLWEWDGSAWHERPVGPSLRHAASLTYDSVRGHSVLFGGRAPAFGAPLSDTWTWNGTTWAQLPVGAPPPRGFHGAAFDESRGCLVIFGGLDGESYLGDTWEWDGTTWIQRASSGPSARSHVSMAYDPSRQKVLLFGGYSGSGQYWNDTWEWNGTSWAPLIVQTPPSPRRAAALAWNAPRMRMMLFGGLTDSGTSTGMWELDGLTWQVQSTNFVSPRGRAGATMVFDQARQQILMFGGIDSDADCTNDVWTFEDSRWLPLFSSRRPSHRGRGSMVGDLRAGGAILFGGGLADNSTAPGETWILHKGAWGQFTDSGVVGERTAYAMAYDSVRQQTVLYGGEAGNATFGDTYVFGAAGWAARVGANQPGVRIGAGMAFDEKRGVCVMFGGTDRANYPTSTWTWNGMQWQLAATEGPGGRWLAAIAYDPMLEKIVMFGGLSASDDALGDTWTWDGLTWSLVNAVPPNSPPPLISARMAFDPNRGRIVLFGGVNGSQARWDTWEFMGDSWQPITGGDPGARYAFPMSLDPSTGRVVVFGGINQSDTFGDTWTFDALGGSPTITSEPSDRTNSVGTLATFTVLASPPSSSPSVSYQWYATVNNAGVQGVVALSNGDRGGRVTQVNGTTLRIANVQASDATSEPVPGVFVNKYFCVVSTPCRGVETRRVVLSVPAPVCSGDTNGDGRVDGADLSVLLGTFNQSVTLGTGADFNADGVVNGADLSVLLGRFGVVC